MRKAKVGLVGCGFISEVYLRNLTQVFSNTEVVAVTDIVEENARKRAEQFHIPVVCKTTKELLQRSDIDIVLNLTIPSQHFTVCREALNAGKHVYTEKPLAMDLDEARELSRLAKEKGLLLSGAPDTFLGSSVQTARRIIDDGWIGRPFGGTSHMFWRGPESWHPDPAFLYQKGAGPLLDSGPYFVTALAYLFGPVESVSCAGRIVHAERTITSQPRYGQKIKVEVPTFVGCLLSFHSGAIVSMMLSADIGNSRMKDPRQHDQAIEIYGTEGTLVVPSPCFYDGAIYYKKNGMEDWAEIPNLYCYQQDSRGLGVADLASAIVNGRPPRVGPDLVYHSYEVLNGLDRAWQAGLPSAIESSFVRTEPLNTSLKLGEIDAP